MDYFFEAVEHEGERALPFLASALASPTVGSSWRKHGRPTTKEVENSNRLSQRLKKIRLGLVKSAADSERTAPLRWYTHHTTPHNLRKESLLHVAG